MSCWLVLLCELFVNVNVNFNVNVNANVNVSARTWIALRLQKIRRQ